MLDVLRGVAIAAMIVYHFFFDLEFFGFGDFGVTEAPGWIAFVRTIPASFLAIAGISLYLAHHNGMHWRNFWWRIGYLVAAAMLVTVISYFADPEAIIWFGILHCIAVSSVIGLAFLRAPLIVVVIAAASGRAHRAAFRNTCTECAGAAVARPRHRGAAFERLQPAVSVVWASCCLASRLRASLRRMQRKPSGRIETG